MNRRDFIRSASVASAGLAIPGTERLFAEGTSFANWRTFEVTTHVEILKSSGTTRLWVLAALIKQTQLCARCRSSRRKRRAGNVFYVSAG
jgi:hypothetical protein